MESMVVPGVSQVSGGIGDSSILGTNSLYTGKGWTQNYLREKCIDEYIGPNVRFTPEDILEVQKLGKIKK